MGSRRFRQRNYPQVRSNRRAINYESVLAFGDSLSSGSRSWVNQVAGGRALGHAGSASANWAIQPYVGEILAELTAYKAAHGNSYAGLYLTFTLGTNDRAFGVSLASYRTNVQNLLNALAFFGFPKAQTILILATPYESELIALLVANPGLKQIAQRSLLETDSSTGNWEPDRARQNERPRRNYDEYSFTTALTGPLSPPAGVHPNRRGQALLAKRFLEIVGDL